MSSRTLAFFITTSTLLAFPLIYRLRRRMIGQSRIESSRFDLDKYLTAQGL